MKARAIQSVDARALFYIRHCCQHRAVSPRAITRHCLTDSAFLFAPATFP